MKIHMSDKRTAMCGVGDVYITIEADIYDSDNALKVEALSVKIGNLVKEFEKANPFPEADEDEDTVHARCKPHDSRIGSHHDEACENYIPF